jgi:chorismate mutase
VDQKVRGIRGAITAKDNTVPSIREAVTELLQGITTHNNLNPQDIVSVVFTVTQDLDAVFPAAIARELPTWKDVPLLDVQQMHVPGSLVLCIRVLIYINTDQPPGEIKHLYLREAEKLRPDLSNCFQNG